MSVGTGVGDILATLRERRSRPVLVAPAPDLRTLRELLAAADNAPDHGRLRPWRYVVVDGPARAGLGDAFAAAHADREPDAQPDAIERSRTRPLRAPMIVVVVARPRPHARVPEWEQNAAAVCAAYGLILAAHAHGYAAMWRTGWFGEAPKVRAHLGLAEAAEHGLAEDVVGWVYLGTADGTPPSPRTPDPDITWLP